MNLARAEHAGLSEAFDDWQGEGQGLSRTSKVSSNNVFKVVDGVETISLNREQVLNASSSQLIGSLSADLGEGCEGVVRRHVLLQTGAKVLFSRKTAVFVTLSSILRCGSGLSGNLSGTSSVYLKMNKKLVKHEMSWTRNKSTGSTLSRSRHLSSMCDNGCGVLAWFCLI